MTGEGLALGQHEIDSISAQDFIDGIKAFEPRLVVTEDRPPYDCREGKFIINGLETTIVINKIMGVTSYSVAITELPERLETDEMILKVKIYSVRNSLRGIQPSYHESYYRQTETGVWEYIPSDEDEFTYTAGQAAESGDESLADDLLMEQLRADGEVDALEAQPGQAPEDIFTYDHLDEIMPSLRANKPRFPKLYRQLLLDPRSGMLPEEVAPVLDFSGEAPLTHVDELEPVEDANLSLRTWAKLHRAIISLASRKEYVTYATAPGAHIRIEVPVEGDLVSPSFEQYSAIDVTLAQPLTSPDLHINGVALSRLSFDYRFPGVVEVVERIIAYPEAGKPDGVFGGRLYPKMWTETYTGSDGETVTVAWRNYDINEAGVEKLIALLGQTQRAGKLSLEAWYQALTPAVDESLKEALERYFAGHPNRGED